MKSTKYKSSMTMFIMDVEYKRFRASGMSANEATQEAKKLILIATDDNQVYPFKSEQDKALAVQKYGVPKVEVYGANAPDLPQAKPQPAPTPPVPIVTVANATKSSAPANPPANATKTKTTTPVVDDGSVGTTKEHYHLVWRTALVAPGKQAGDIDILTVKNAVTINTLLQKALTKNILIPLSSRVSLCQEYSPSVQNKLVQQTTLGGNSVTVFGQGPKKIGMKVTLVKAGNHAWMNYKNALEALHFISGNPGRYFGNLYLYGFDADSMVSPRKYKVTMESLNMSMRSDKTTQVDIDITFIVNHDFSLRPLANAGAWGRL